MNKITKFLKTNKYVILWTAAYITIVWAILLFLFNFNIFIGHQWELLMHAEIKGFAGFVFGILMLAALPMYIATTAVIIRTKQPLITVNIKPVIKIFTAIIPNPVPAATPEKIINTDVAPQITDNADDKKNATPGDEFPTTMPSELRGAFIRARQHIEQFAPSAFNNPSDIIPTPEISSPENPTITDVGELPLPTDFSFDTQNDSDLLPDVAMPTFTDINFGDDDDDDNIHTAPDINTNNDDDNDIINYLTECGCTARRDGDMIIANNIIIAVHRDPDFWIADPDNWFAAGKQIASPITQLIKASAKHGLRPVLYLAETNIMDLDKCRAEWDKMGVTTITDLNKLPL